MKEKACLDDSDIGTVPSKKKKVYCRVWKIWSRRLMALTVSCASSMYYRHITSAYMLFLIFCQKTLDTASF